MNRNAGFPPKREFYIIDSLSVQIWVPRLDDRRDLHKYICMLHWKLPKSWNKTHSDPEFIFFLIQLDDTFKVWVYIYIYTQLKEIKI